jgi:hypothetical protein
MHAYAKFFMYLKILVLSRGFSSDVTAWLLEKESSLKAIKCALVYYSSSSFRERGEDIEIILVKSVLILSEQSLFDNC